MKRRKLFLLVLVMVLSTGLMGLAFCLGGAPDVGTRVIGAEPSADDPSTALVTIELTNAGSSLVWFGPTQTMQAKTGDEWLAPQKLDRRLSWIVLQPRTNLDIVITVPKAARACRLLLSYGGTPQRTKWAYFCRDHDGICSKVPKLCFWVGQRLRKDPVCRARVIELMLPR